MDFLDQTGPWALLFGGCLLALLYAYLGYPLLLALLVRRRTERVLHDHDILPTVSFILPMYNEAQRVEDKLRDCLDQDYPPQRMEIVLVDDGSDDGTASFARDFAAARNMTLREAHQDIPPDFSPGLTLLVQPRRSGKAQAMNRAAARARGDLLVFSDADCRLDPDALCLLARRFADPLVGCAAARHGGAAEGGVGLYWRYEDRLRRLESDFGGILGASGTLYAIRRGLYEPLDPAMINDDFIVAMRVNAGGHRSVYEPRARGWEEGGRSRENEFARRVRIMVGNCQQLRLFVPLLLRKGRWGVAFQLLSHKLPRLVSPLLLLTMAAASLVELFARGGLFWETAVLAQGIFYLAALVATQLPLLARRHPLLQLPYYFVQLNLAAAAGVWHYLLHGSRVAWGEFRGPAPLPGRSGVD